MAREGNFSSVQHGVQSEEVSYAPIFNFLNDPTIEKQIIILVCVGDISVKGPCGCTVCTWL